MRSRVFKSFIVILILVAFLVGCMKVSDNNDKETNMINDLTNNTVVEENILIANEISYEDVVNEIDIDGIKELNKFQYVTINDNTSIEDLDRYVKHLNNDASNIILQYMTEKHNVSVEAIMSLDYKDITYVLIKVPGYGITYENKYDKVTSNTYELWKVENNQCKR